MKAFVAYDRHGQITGVGVPNPKLGDQLEMKSPDGGVLVIDVMQLVGPASGLTFATSGQAAIRLQESVRGIVDKYRVDPGTRRLTVPERHPSDLPGRRADSDTDPAESS